MIPIRLHGVRKHFGKTKAVDGIDLQINAGDLFFLLGPSGCGKTTLLRMVAGFTLPTDGRIYFGDKDVTQLPTNQRDTGMVFQGYALWPHMTVYQNVEFGLTVGKRKGQFTAADRKTKVEQALGVVQIEQYADRKINQLSGGQQQRVALARALVIEPSVLLLDEPLSNLDAKLRLEMRQEIRRICKQAGITGVYVTHDQKEALSMADGIAVLAAGKIMQTGSPRELYERPATRFVADFLGESNFLPARVQSTEGKTITLETPAGTLTSAAFPEGLNTGTNVTCSIRPEAIHIAPEGSTVNRIPAERVSTVYLGEMAQYKLRVNDSTELKMFELNPRLIDNRSPTLAMAVDPRDVVILRD